MDELGGAGAEDVHAQQRAGPRRDQQLQHAVGVAEDLAAGQLAVAGDADLVRASRPSVSSSSVRADEADLGDRVDADRLQVAMIASTGSPKAW